MSALTRSRSDNTHQETWHVYYDGNVHAGTIGERAGVPIDVDQWGWACGFYPGLEPGRHRYGSGATIAKPGRLERDGKPRSFRQIRRLQRGITLG
jgi:hypothetical protein